MSLNLNNVVLAGRLTATPELKATPNGISVTSFSIAVDRAGAKDTEKITDFINVVAWRKTAEFIAHYFQKGSAICVVGSIQTRSWKDQNGSNRYATEVVANEAKFVESKATSSSPADTAAAYPPAQSATFEELNPDDDELPF